MSQIEMKELQDWLNSPTALKFKKILLNSRAELLNGITRSYLKKGSVFNKDFVLSRIGGCEALEQVSSYFGTKDEATLENLIKVFLGGENA